MENKIEKTKKKNEKRETQSQRNAMKNNDVEMRQSHVSVDCFESFEVTKRQNEKKKKKHSLKP